VAGFAFRTFRHTWNSHISNLRPAHPSIDAVCRSTHPAPEKVSWHALLLSCSRSHPVTSFLITAKGSPADSSAESTRTSATSRTACKPDALEESSARNAAIHGNLASPAGTPPQQQSLPAEMPRLLVRCAGPTKRTAIAPKSCLIHSESSPPQLYSPIKRGQAQSLPSPR
jgi:hypothetical protein